MATPGIMALLLGSSLRGMSRVQEVLESNGDGINGLFHRSLPIGSMYGIYTYIYYKVKPHVGEYTIHGSYGL